MEEYSYLIIGKNLCTERDMQKYIHTYIYIRLWMQVCIIKMGIASFAEPHTLLNIIEREVIIWVTIKKKLKGKSNKLVWVWFQFWAESFSRARWFFSLLHSIQFSIKLFSLGSLGTSQLLSFWYFEPKYHWLFIVLQ